jgi:hypothetical protein
MSFVQDASREDGLAHPTTLLTSNLHPDVQYIVDTANSDYILNTEITRSLIPAQNHARIQWAAHAGDHGEHVAMCDSETADISALRLRLLVHQNIEASSSAIE